MYSRAFRTFQTGAKLHKKQILSTRAISSRIIVTEIRRPNTFQLHSSSSKKFLCDLQGVMQENKFYSTESNEESTIDSNTFEKVCEETLSSLADFFEDMVVSHPKLEKSDILYSVGVLTIDLGQYGSYVINRQSPNKQIWLSSPTSGPKRYDFSMEENCWIYRHDGVSLHSLLEKEFGHILGKEVVVTGCAHCGES